MAKIAFLGIGAIGLPMAQNLASVGHQVVAYDPSRTQMSRLENTGGRAAGNPADAVSDAQFILTCLPDAATVETAYFADDGFLKDAPRSAIVIDCSLTGPDEARKIGAQVESLGFTFLEAPVIGTARDARSRLITIVAAGSLAAFSEARPVLEDMAERVIHVGKAGLANAAVLANQLMTVVNMVAAAESFALGERLGVPAEKLFEITSLSTATSWALVEHCPQSGLVPEAPSNNMYQAGIAASRALQGLGLIEDMAKKVDARVPLTQTARDLYLEYCNGTDGKLDFSAIIQLLRRR